MNLYKYFESLINDDFIDANGLLLYNKLISEKDIKKISEQKEIRLLNKYEFNGFTTTKKNNLINLLQDNFNLNNPIRFFIKDDYDVVFYDGEFHEQGDIELDVFSIRKGIGIFKPNVVQKEYKTLDDLNNPNINLFIRKENNITKIICYDTNILNNEYNQQEKFKNPILFFANLSNYDINDRYNLDEDKTPFGASTVEIAVAREDVAGSETLYPIMAYFSDNHLIIPDRSSVSSKAQNVWKKFLNGRGKIKKFDPIDDIYNPITQNLEDDGQTYVKHGRFKEKNKVETKEIHDNPSLKETDREIILKELRKNDELNWVYKLSDNEILKTEKIISYLIENHKKTNITYNDLISRGYTLYSSKVN